ncbi:MAG: LysR family transcriptional regulator [Rhizobiaceae bacterium]|nr:LysR family transcriptional regulator [Rhizobiaceae bacterium]
MNIESLSLDQLRVILCVVEEGSFSAAARHFRRTQSAVSYSVAQAEAQLGVVLFDRSGRTPDLTAAGKALVGDIRTIVARVDGLRARARAVSEGVEPEITLVVDAICCPESLSELMRDFNQRFPATAVRLHIETLGMVVEKVLRSRCALGVIATMVDLPDGLTRYAMPPVRMHAVAAAGHPLAASAPKGAAESLQSAIQIVLSDRSSRTLGRDYAVYSPSTWRVDDLATKRALIRAGVGWGSLPDWMIEDEVGNGILAVLTDLGFPDPDDMPTQVFHDTGHLPGPGMGWLIDELRRRGLGRVAF